MVTSTQPVGHLSTLESLKSSPHFAGLENSVLERIGRFMVERRIAKHEVIWLEQSTASRVYFVASGLINLFKMSTEGKEQIIRLARPGDSFGHNGILNGGCNPESAQALVTSVLCGITKSDFQSLLLESKQFTYNTIRALATEMHHYLSLVEDLSLRGVNCRLARMLMEYNTDGVFDESLTLTRGDMAAMTGTVREVLGKSLKALEEKGVIISNRRQIVIRDGDALKMMASSF